MPLSQKMALLQEFRDLLVFFMEQVDWGSRIAIDVVVSIGVVRALLLLYTATCPGQPCSQAGPAILEANEIG